MAQLEPAAGGLRLHIFADCSSVEVFANDGLSRFAVQIFLGGDSQGTKLLREEMAATLWRLEIFYLVAVKFFIHKTG